MATSGGDHMNLAVAPIATITIYRNGYYQAICVCGAGGTVTNNGMFAAIEANVMDRDAAKSECSRVHLLKTTP